MAKIEVAIPWIWVLAGLGAPSETENVVVCHSPPERVAFFGSKSWYTSIKFIKHFPKTLNIQADWLCNPSTCRSNYTATPKMKLCVEISFLATDDPKYIIEHKRVNRTITYLHTYNYIIYIWNIYYILQYVEFY